MARGGCRPRAAEGRAGPGFPRRLRSTWGNRRLRVHLPGPALRLPPVFHDAGRWPAPPRESVAGRSACRVCVLRVLEKSAPDEHARATAPAAASSVAGPEHSWWRQRRSGNPAPACPPGLVFPARGSRFPAAPRPSVRAPVSRGHPPFGPVGSGPGLPADRHQPARAPVGPCPGSPRRPCLVAPWVPSPPARPRWFRPAGPGRYVVFGSVIRPAPNAGRGASPGKRPGGETVGTRGADANWRGVQPSIALNSLLRCDWS